LIPRDSSSRDWAVLYYLCGHYNRPGEQDPFVTALADIQAAGATPAMSAAVYLDLESGAQRVAMQPGEEPESESIGAVNSGDPKTLEQFLAWAFDACPARRYVLVMAGLGIMDSDSVVGRPPFDSTRTFAICDDRATDDAIELDELAETLRNAFPHGGSRRLVMLACDMYATQFMEVAYELRGLTDILLGIQPDHGDTTLPLANWPYPQLLKRWQEIVAAPDKSTTPRWRLGVDPQGLLLARETIALLAAHYRTVAAANPPTVSALNLTALAPLGQALDTFSVVYLQWLSNDVVWRARENVVTAHSQALEQSWSYDLAEVAKAIQMALAQASREALVRWALTAMPTLSYTHLSAALRALGAAARELARNGDQAALYRSIADQIAAVRSAIERGIAIGTAPAPAEQPQHSDIVKGVRALFVDAANPEGVREPDAWNAIVTGARSRYHGTQARELADAFDGIEAASQLSRLAGRVAELARGADEGKQPVVIALWPESRQCGISLYRPIDLDKLAESNYLNLRFSRELHWTTLLTAVDLIKNHARMLWRLVESQLTAAPLEARYNLMRRLAGDRALTGRHADQLRALSVPAPLFLTIEPVASTPDQPAPSTAGDPVDAFCVRLSSLDRSSNVLERRNEVTHDRLERVLVEIDAVGSNTTADPRTTIDSLSRCGSLLGDDILYGISERLAEIEPPEDRAVHLVLQVPRELMRYPWELLRDRRGWLVERFAIGRQVIADAETVPRWGSPSRHGPLRLLVVAPTVEGGGSELAGVGALEGSHVAESFKNLQLRLPGLVEPLDYLAHVGTRVTVEDFRTLLRDGRYDVVHFAGHGRYDKDHPERSCWLFSDGPLYAFELRHTLANADVTPWLVYGSACEGARDGDAGGTYHDGIYGMASAALGQGVGAYIGPLWTISETDAKNLASAFYDALLLRRSSIGESLALARRSVKEGEPDLDELQVAISERAASGRAPVRSAGWAGMILYGDPTPTVLQRLSPSDTVGERTATAGAAANGAHDIASVLNRTAGSPSTT
jgi:hypothetical protein